MLHPLFYKIEPCFMKRMYFFTCLFAMLMTWSISAQQTGQDSTGLPGDNFSLQGALDLFKKAASPEEFEKALNTESNHVNNLDLDQDDKIDYVRVVDKSDDKAHALILQVPVTEKESQDIAVIELEKNGEESAMIQIVGDSAIYGEEVIVEPSADAKEESAQKGKGPNANYEVDEPIVVVNVWGWPSVRYVYAPVYHPWVSPYHYHYYPPYWHPWPPAAWHVWHPYHYHYHSVYVITPTHRVVHAHGVYSPYRATSVTVHKHYATPVNHYRVNTHKTTVHGPHGHQTTMKQTTVRGPNGHVKGKKTTVRHH